MATKKTRSNKSKVKICSCHTAAPQPNDFPRLFKLMQIQMSQEPRFALLLCHSWVPEVLFTGLLSRRWMLRFESLCCLGDVAWHRAAEKLLFHGGFLMRRQAMRWCFRVCTWMNLRFWEVHHGAPIKPTSNSGLPRQRRIAHRTVQPFLWHPLAVKDLALTGAVERLSLPLIILPGAPNERAWLRKKVTLPNKMAKAVLNLSSTLEINLEFAKVQVAFTCIGHNLRKSSWIC